MTRARCDGRSTRRHCWRSVSCRCSRCTRFSACSVAAVEPAGPWWGLAGPRVQHRGVVHDQYELAGLRRRIHHELSHADGRSRLPQLCLGRGRHRPRGGLHPRHRSRERETIGNFWVDTTRALLWMLLPVCVVVALVFVSQGVVQNLKPYDVVAVVEPQTAQRRARR